MFRLLILTGLFIIAYIILRTSSRTVPLKSKLESENFFIRTEVLPPGIVLISSEFGEMKWISKASLYFISFQIRK